jgi:hypothetical protein
MPSPHAGDAGSNKEMTSTICNSGCFIHRRALSSLRCGNDWANIAGTIAMDQPTITGKNSR